MPQVMDPYTLNARGGATPAHLMLEDMFCVAREDTVPGLYSVECAKVVLHQMR